MASCGGRHCTDRAGRASPSLRAAGPAAAVAAAGLPAQRRQAQPTSVRGADIAAARRGGLVPAGHRCGRWQLCAYPEGIQAACRHPRGPWEHGNDSRSSGQRLAMQTWLQPPLLPSLPNTCCFRRCPPARPSPPCSRTCTDVVRKIITGDVDLGIVGLDMLAEIGNDDPGGWVGAGGVLQGGCVGGSGWWQRGGWCRI